MHTSDDFWGGGILEKIYVHFVPNKLNTELEKKVIFSEHVMIRKSGVKLKLKEFYASLSLD